MRPVCPTSLLCLSTWCLPQMGTNVESHHFAFPARPITWSDQLDLPRFRSGQGQLHSIRLEGESDIYADIGVENVSNSPALADATFLSALLANGPSLSLATLPSGSFSFPLTAYDGVLDYGGTSGSTASLGSLHFVDESVLSDPVGLEQYVGDAGTMHFNISYVGQSQLTGPSQFYGLISALVDFEVTVSYEYTPWSTGYCLGDGTATPCPCGNSSAPRAQAGCAHSLGVGGVLATFGIPSLAADSLVLLGSQMPDSTALYFQGTTRHAGGIGAVFGDGLRCAGGVIVRIGVKGNAQGASGFPEAGDSRISTIGMVGSGDCRTYQVWYRNSANYCTTSTFNLTNGIELTWLP